VIRRCGGATLVSGGGVSQAQARSRPVPAAAGLRRPGFARAKRSKIAATNDALMELVFDSG